jgi:hypothetical protein
VRDVCANDPSGVVECDRLELWIRARAGVRDDGRFETVLACVDRGLHDAAFSGGPDQNESVDLQLLNEQVEWRVVER